MMKPCVITGLYVTLKDATELLLKNKISLCYYIRKGRNIARMEGKTAVIKSIKVNPVDTTGAGDAFCLRRTLPAKRLYI